MQKKAIIVFVREPRYLPIFVIHLKNERGVVSNQTLIDATIAFYRNIGYDNVKVTIRNKVIEVVKDPVSNPIPKVHFLAVMNS